MIKLKKNRVFRNTVMLMIFYIAKMVFPFITLPYLTRIFTTEVYGSVAYVKTVMSYMQIIVDFGFIISAVKDIVKVRQNKNKMEYVLGDTIFARVIMGIVGLIILLILIIFLPILRSNILYTILSYVVVLESIFLMDFLFRGLEIMHVITIRFILMKTISTILTFILVKNDGNMLLIPILDILSSFIAIVLVMIQLKKLKIKPKFSGLKKALITIKDSGIYFISNAAATSFNALSTIIIGLQMGATDVAYWSVCMQVIGSITACYTPIADGLYPEMIKTKNINLIKKTIKIIMPIVTLGCFLSYFLSGFILKILGGENYLVAIPVFRLLIPTLFFCFLAVILGWSTLGVIEKSKEVTFSTIASILINLLLLVILIFTNSFTLINIAIVRSMTECILFFIRFYFCRKYRNLFSNN